MNNSLTEAQARKLSQNALVKSVEGKGRRAVSGHQPQPGVNQKEIDCRLCLRKLGHG